MTVVGSNPNTVYCILTFFTYIGFKNCHICLKRRKQKTKRGCKWFDLKSNAKEGSNTEKF